VHVSNFRPVKKIRDVLGIFQRVQRSMPARMLLIGDGPDRSLAERLARDGGFEEKTTFLGNVAAIETILPAARLMLLPSDAESFGLAASRPWPAASVIRTAAGGCRGRRTESTDTAPWRRGGMAGRAMLIGPPYGQFSSARQRAGGHQDIVEYRRSRRPRVGAARTRGASNREVGARFGRASRFFGFAAGAVGRGQEVLGNCAASTTRRCRVRRVGSAGGRVEVSMGTAGRDGGASDRGSHRLLGTDRRRRRGRRYFGGTKLGTGRLAEPADTRPNARSRPAAAGRSYGPFASRSVSTPEPGGPAAFTAGRRLFARLRPGAGSSSTCGAPASAQAALRRPGSTSR
jgi:hypothetical protein